ncbi:MAG: S16 family serine protease [Pseudomonadota bacterium]
MFPLEFDHTVLDSLPVPRPEHADRVIQLLRAILVRRVLPFFRKNRGTDPIITARVGENIAFERLEDDGNLIRGVSFVTRKDSKWIIHVHERVFDYLAFVMPTSPDAALGTGTPDERKMFAFAEFMVRHQVEHLLYPESTETEVLNSDAAFAMDRRVNDPTFYRALRSSLADEMSGLKGRPYLALFDQSEQERPVTNVASGLLNDYVGILADVPERFLRDLFPCLCTELKTKLLGVYYRRSRDTAYSLLKRAAFLRMMLRLFGIAVERDEKEGYAIFEEFKNRWGLIHMFQELGLPEGSLETREWKPVFDMFKDALQKLPSPFDGEAVQEKPTPTPATAVPKPAEPVVKSLKDRILDARNDPKYPRQVIEVIEKNRLNAVGHSGSKYSELIETLLAIPWGKIQKIEVSPQEFEKGINSTHYGLQKPKETLCDFFSNLIWRYHRYRDDTAGAWRRNGSAFLFVGPPGVGKTSLAISVALNLKIPFHKISLGGMRDEADLKGHGFTYEGSNPGAIVQGLIKTGIMNGMFIMDEADKVEKFAVATLLEILDPEQNHLYHDKYTETTVDIDLSNCHFVLTANTLETVPPPVLNRCEVVLLDRYSIEEKVAIAREHLIRRVRERYQIGEDQVYLDPADEAELMRYLIKTYTHEAGVRELERIVRTLFLRISRKEFLANGKEPFRLSREKIKDYLTTPKGPRPINEEDRRGEMMALGINVEHGVGSLIPVQATGIHLGDSTETRQSFLSMVHATGNIERIMDESRKVATTAILDCAEELGLDVQHVEAPIHLHFMGGSTPKDGPSAGGAIALALASVLSGSKVRRDVAMTGEVDTHGRITGVGGLDIKLETAYDAGCKTVIIPTENLSGEDGIEGLSEALKRELQVLTYDQWSGDHHPFDRKRHVLEVVAVDSVVQAAHVAFVDDEELKRLGDQLVPHAHATVQALADSDEERTGRAALHYIKEAWELECFELGGILRTSPRFCVLLRAQSEEAVLTRYPELEQSDSCREFDPKSPTLGAELAEIAAGLRSTETDEVFLVAPYYFLKRSLNKGEALPEGGKGFVLCADNFTLQGFKIKRCKAVMHRLFHHLARLGKGHLDGCPFVARINDIVVADLSFIPERYRLDVKRAETIFSNALQAWLSTVEGAGSGLSFVLEASDT